MTAGSSVTVAGSKVREDFTKERTMTLKYGVALGRFLS